MSKKAVVFTAALILSAVTALFASTVSAYFVSDDFILVKNVRQGGPFGVWTLGSFGWFRPIISLSLYVDHRVSGLNAAGYHVTNILSHALNTALVMLSTFLLCERSESDRDTGVMAALVAGAVFGVLPSHSEAVAWISGRTDVISTLFYLCAWCLYLLYRRADRRVYFAASWIAFVGALLSKESAATFPAIVMVYEGYQYLVERRRHRPPWRAVAAYFAILPVYLLVRHAATGTWFGGYGAGVHFNFDPLRWIGGPPIFLARTLLPCCGPYDAIAGALNMAGRIWFMRWFYFLAGVVVISGVFMVSVAGLRRRARLWGLCVWLLLIGLLTQLPSVSIGLQAETSIGERLVYTPSVFVCAFLALFILLVFRRWPLAKGTIILGLLVVYATALWHSNQHWNQAGRLARSILDSMTRLDRSQPVLLLGIPDHINGAMIFRNGLQEASDLFGIGGTWQTVVLSTLETPQDGTIVVPTDEGYELRLTNPRSVLVLAPSVALTDVSVTLAQAGTMAVLSLNEAQAYQVVYYSQGQLWPVQPVVQSLAHVAAVRIISALALQP